MPEVLFTKEITNSQIKTLHNIGWGTTCTPFIECTFSFNKELLTECLSNKKKTDAYIFTSKNAVRAIQNADLTKYLSQKPVFCIGKKTGKLLEELGINVIYSPEASSETLAYFILKEYPEIKHLTYFCGNIRREELPKILINAGKVLKEVTVYKTELRYHKIDKTFDAIVFYSPSAVGAFFKNNKIKNRNTLIALGNATAMEIEKFHKGNIEIPESPDTEAVIESLRKIENV